MSDLIAFCGLVCQTCPIYRATRLENKDTQTRLRLKIARVCLELYGVKYAPEEINDCDGCSTEGGRLFVSCAKCQIRTCAKQKGLANCAACPEYACEKLSAIFVSDPAAKTRLDQIRKGVF